MLLWIIFSVTTLIVIAGLVTAISAAPVLTLAIAGVAGAFFYLRAHHK